MPAVTLRLRKADGSLPPVCMHCGEAATVTKTKTLSWCPPWVVVLLLLGLLPYAIAALILTKRACVQAPFCDEHRGHWLNRALLMWGTFIVFGILGIACILAATSLPQPAQDKYFPFVCLGTAGLLLTWIIIAIIAQNTAIRPKEITKTDITLTGVSEAFIDAVQDAQEERRRQKRSARGRWRDEEEDLDEPRPRNRPASDAFEAKPPRRNLPPPDAVEED